MGGRLARHGIRHSRTICDLREVRQGFFPSEMRVEGKGARKWERTARRADRDLGVEDMLAALVSLKDFEEMNEIAYHILRNDRL